MESYHTATWLSDSTCFSRHQSQTARVGRLSVFLLTTMSSSGPSNLAYGHVSYSPLPSNDDDDLDTDVGVDGNDAIDESDALTDASSDYIQSQGVTRMEAVQRATQNGSATMWAVGISIVVCAWAYSLDKSTTPNYAPFATSSFAQHSSGLATLQIATNIISAVSKPFVAKISDITSRPYTYLFILAFYVVGYVVVATCRTISAYVTGEVFVSIGSAGLDLLNEIIVGDLTPLEWRGFVSSMLSVPFIINTWFAGKIVAALATAEKWRWGYGMFAIIMPVVLLPAIATLIRLDIMAQRQGIVNIASSNAARRRARALAEVEGVEAPHGAVVARAVRPQTTWTQQLHRNLTEIDAGGLILLGVGWAFLLLPFSMKSQIDGGWANPVLRTMAVFGVAFLVLYIFFERFVSRIPSAPRRLLLNRTFIMAIIIDFVYFVAGQMRGTYFASYVWIVQDFTLQNWTYFNNTMTIALCVFGIVVGLLQRWTHHYKRLQIFGLTVKLIGMGVLLVGTQDSVAAGSTGVLALSQVLIGSGGAFSVVGSRVASQASVPHQDLALVVALLALWSKVGAAIGSAVAATIWSARMPVYLRQYMPASVSDDQVKVFFGDIRRIREYDMQDPIRQAAILAYQRTLYHLIVPAFFLSFIPLVAACFQTDYYLGKQQNAVMNVGVDGRHVTPDPSGDDDSDESLVASLPPKVRRERFLRFWAGK
ncbi:MFS general substrate transporter [Fistulina hepatica ATCC 64428]|uniref:MFS general substrate transporter n=1 Tax=Fistulina hepatica ATCC 64428 TaxID=1128425 RepID=A0A0D7ASJ7_9AGAR|nr:MFS general substrate transporter [Fistulina hepatica ATCC 64428]